MTPSMDEAGAGIVERGAMSEMCGQPHPFGGFTCSKKVGHDKTHYFAAMWESDEEAIESLVDHIAETDPRSRDVIRLNVEALVERRKRWL